MKKEDRVLLTMLAKELFNKPLNIGGLNINWDECLSSAEKHCVIPVIFKSVLDISQEHEVPSDVINKVRFTTVAAVVSDEHKLQVQDRIISLLQLSNIPYVILKGTSVAGLYPHPELRHLGDIDILVSVKDFQAAKAIIYSDGHSSYNEDHRLHASFSIDYVLVELHHTVSVFADDLSGRYAAELFTHALDETDNAEIDVHKFSILKPAYQLLSLLFHMSRHMVGPGIGLRQVCDWAVSVDHYRDLIDSEILDLFQKCGMLPFAKTLTHACVMYLGLPPVTWCQDVDILLCNAMIEEIVNSGNMSYQLSYRSLSSLFVEPGQNQHNYDSMSKSFIKTCNKIVKEKHPLTQKFPVILPVFWMIIPLKYFARSQKGERPKLSIIRVLRIAFKRKRLYSKLGLFVK